VVAGRARRLRKVEALGDLLPEVLRQTSKTAQAIQNVQASWERLVGKELALHSKPVRIRRMTLYVQTDEPGTNFGLSLLRVRLLDELPALVGGPIRDIVVRAGALQ
jgi:predicted nucleic acid-binding Zn ribbon protein